MYRHSLFNLARIIIKLVTMDLSLLIYPLRHIDSFIKIFDCFIRVLNFNHKAKVELGPCQALP